MNYEVSTADTYDDVYNSFCTRIKAYVDSGLITEVDDLDFYPVVYTDDGTNGALLDITGGSIFANDDQIVYAVGFKKRSSPTC